MKQSNGRKDRFPIFRERLNNLLGDMSTTEFADKVDVSRQTMGFYLNGERIPDSLTLARICKVCSVSSDWLLGLTNDPKPKPCAVDELGITSEAINALTNYTQEQRDGLSKLLENKIFGLLCGKISRYVNIPDSNKIEIPNDESHIRYFLFETQERNLEKTLVSSNRELDGKIKVLVGYNLSSYYKREILDSFEGILYSLQSDKSKAADM